jgi:hypothetical protein
MIPAMQKNIYSYSGRKTVRLNQPVTGLTHNPAQAGFYLLKANGKLCFERLKINF